MKRRVAVAAILFGFAFSAGCSSDGPASDYCKDLKKSRASMETLGTSDARKLDDTFATIRRLTDKAPDAVEKDWDKLSKAIEKVEVALKDIGLEIGDFADIQQGKIPKGITAENLQPVAEALGAMSSTSLTNASARIEQHANNVCQVPLDGF